ncbi:NUDIX hydrolase [Euzebya pacifica]|uniref:NUDIX hydrolase n=1 Tax=Euzebya pacifica TaxID=1608957 RepID=UPI0030F83E95
MTRPPVPDVATLSERILLHQPKAATQAWAATALVLGEGPVGPSVLMIRRLSRDGDPWSGDMALPGGKVDPTDISVEAAAARETAEEVGVHVGTPLNRVDDLESHRFTSRIATAVFTVDGTPRLTPEPGEVAEAVWLPVADLADPTSRTWHRYGGIVPFRSITVGDYMIWGLTHRILTHFFSVTGLD